MPVISVLIPNYNRSTPLVRAVRSVLRQADERVEVIVVDDASSADLAATYDLLASLGVRIVRLPQRRSGSRARNVAVAEARGTFVSFLDSDDLWLPGHCDRLLGLVPDLDGRTLLSGVMLYQWGEVVAFEQPSWTEGASPVDFIYRDGGRLQTSMLTLSREVAEAHPFREDLRVNQDSDFALRLHRSGVLFRVDPEPGIIKDESDGADRLSRDAAIVDLSHQWFRDVSRDWPPAARSGFQIRDRAWRLVAAGRRFEALGAVVRGSLPPVAPGSSARIAAEAIVGHDGYRRARQAFRRLFPRPQAAVPQGSPALSWLLELDAEAQALLAGEPAGRGAR